MGRTEDGTIVAILHGRRIIDLDRELLVDDEDEPDLLVDFPRRHVLLQVKVLKLSLDLDRLKNAFT